MKVVEHAALLGSSGRDKGLGAGLDFVLGELGFTCDDGGERTLRPPRQTGDKLDLEIEFLTPERGAWACLGTTPAMARAIATRIAARLQQPIQLFTATARYDDRKLECTIEDRLVKADGKTAVGTLARDLEASCGGNWRDLCDSKPYAAITALIESAIEQWIAAACKRRDAMWRAPPSLGDRRLDELALRIRLAAHAQLTTVDGRPCVRVITADGATTMSFLTADELARLEPAVAVLLAR